MQNVIRILIYDTAPKWIAGLQAHLEAAAAREGGRSRSRRLEGGAAHDDSKARGLVQHAFCSRCPNKFKFHCLFVWHSMERYWDM